jgi:hypothetical protein
MSIMNDNETGVYGFERLEGKVGVGSGSCSCRMEKRGMGKKAAAGEAGWHWNLENLAL